MVQEMRCRAPAFAALDGPSFVGSIYFGGGTPSLAPQSFFDHVIAAVRDRFPVADDAEITVEVNPETVDRKGLGQLRTTGVNRISLGMQSTHDTILARLGRTHSACSAREAYRASRQAGFENTSVDLIFGVPGQSLKDLEADLSAAVDLAPEHVSIYELTYHAGTPLRAQVDSGALTPADEPLVVAMMDTIHERLDAAGYEHYEVSNYARPGRRAVHNSLYWSGACYLGIGPGAHSFLRRGWQVGWRWESRQDPFRYVRAWSVPTAGGAKIAAPGRRQRLAEPSGRPLPAAAVDGGDPTVQWCEELSAEQLFSERMMCGLRLRDGVHLVHDTPSHLRDRAQAAAQEAVARGWAERRGDWLAPTPLGFRFADSLAALFF
jgi:oxygen-independent coproporphyrinogen-3 oxidase